jgi:hypothetical protein
VNIFKGEDIENIRSMVLGLEEQLRLQREEISKLKQIKYDI